MEKQKEVQDLKTALELKSNEAQQKNHTLEELNNALDAMKKELNTKNKELEDAKSELNELSKVVEEKSQEADESMDKYCTLMIQVHKLEETNNALTARLEQTSTKQTNNPNVHSSSRDSLRRSGRKSSSRLHVADRTENTVPSSSQRSPVKRGHSDITAQELLHNLTKKIKANAATTPKPHTEHEDEFRPEGLPELVQKGTENSLLATSVICSLFFCVDSYPQQNGNHVFCMMYFSKGLQIFLLERPVHLLLGEPQFNAVALDSWQNKVALQVSPPLQQLTTR